MAKTYPFSYRQVAEKLQAGDLLCQGPVTLLRISTPEGIQELPADLPWGFVRYRWMLPFLLCLEKHGREDCMCWSKKRGKTAYIGWRKTERQLLSSHPPFSAPWAREKQLASSIWQAAHPGEVAMADSTIPWAKDLLEHVRLGRTPSGAATLMGMHRFYVTSARKRHPWFNELLTRAGYPPREWRAQFPPARRAK